jgi:PAS domain S-box-containing protein
VSTDLDDTMTHRPYGLGPSTPPPSVERLAPLVGSGLVSVDSGGLITAWTAQAERTFGWHRGEVIGHPLVATTVAPHQRQRGEHDLERVLAGEAPRDERRFEIVARHRDGREFTIEIALVPVPLGRGSEFSAFLDDIGSRDWTAEELGRLRVRHAGVLEAAAEAFRSGGEDELDPGRLAGALVLFHAPELEEEGPPEEDDGPQSTGHSPEEETESEPEFLPQSEPEPDFQPEPEPSYEPEPEPSWEPPPAAGEPEPEPEFVEAPLAVYQGAAEAPAPISSERLRQTLDEERFIVSCQPALDLRTNEVAHFELLLRMTDENGRLVLPQAFMGVAERSGLMRSIDHWLVRRAIGLIAEQQQKGRYVRLELSLSAHSLDDHDLPFAIEQWLAATGADPTRLVLGVTEEVAAAAVDVTSELAARLKSIGCRFALRDFGSSFAAMRHLKKLPLDYLKLEGGLISTLADSRTDQLVLKAIVDIAHGMGAETVAELVSDEQTLVLLRQAGVSYAQGYHVGPPRRASEAWSALGHS